MTIRPATLRRYYEATFDGRDNERFEGASFDEYYELVRRLYPTMTQWHAASASARQGRPDFLALVSKFPQPADPYAPDERAVAREQHPDAKVIKVIKKKTADLEPLIPASKAGAFLECEGTALTGWEALSRAKPWHRIELRKCKVDPKEAPPAPVPCEYLNVTSCEMEAVGFIALATSCRRVRVTYLDEPLDLSVFARHAELDSLTVSCELAYGARHLRKGLRELRLSLAELVRDVKEALPHQAGTLEALGITTADAFGPEDLPPLPRLKKLLVPAFPPVRSQWIDFAVKHPDVHVEFGRSPEAGARYEARRNDVDVVSAGPVKKRVFQWVRVLAELPDAASQKDLTGKAKGAGAKLELLAGGRILVCRGTSEEAALAALDGMAASQPTKAQSKQGSAKPTPSRTESAESAESADALESWEGEVDEKALRESRRILNELGERLAAMSKEDRAERGSDAVADIVRRLNDLDRKLGHFITTIEAEDLHEAIGAVAKRYGLHGWEKVVDRTRSW